ncbi:squalene-hopene cyclase [Bacillus manliponensis]|uniref:Squalene-hopene cyclase n=1 Tax=Bacillus manliponensis TaxID=574376 RepID=A0A073JWZ7_9BACI|nr:squalene--hopene cyclase [Bacillus manliponensis]KEK18810.1 squalene-hopene cyclase [Bacillus manliponensis]
MLLYDKVKHEVERRITALRTMQRSDGTWRFCFEGSPLTDCWMILLLRLLQRHDEIEPFVERLVSMQTNHGTWKLYEDEPVGHLSTTIDIYTALLASNYYRKEDYNMKRAEAFISHEGGIANAHFMTKFMLAVHGQYKYPSLFYLPTPILFLPDESPLSIYQISSSARIHLIPMALCMNKRFSVQRGILPNMNYIIGKSNGSWFREERSSLLETMVAGVKNIVQYPLSLHHKGYKAAERFMMERLEQNGLLYSYASSTFYMIYALLALGHSTQSPVIISALRGLQSYVWNTKVGAHVQNSPSTIWDTALFSYALQEAGVAPEDPLIQGANEYLIRKQHSRYGDWHINAPTLSPGGWGFSDVNTTIPDCDDTTAVLRSLTEMAKKDRKGKQAWDKGIDWVTGLQNKDGGWGAFEKGVTSHLFEHVPLENAKDMMTDPSTADITGRVLEFFGTYAPNKLLDENRNRAIRWLIENQENNGSWYGKWGVCYIYGTWAAITGLRAVHVSPEHPGLQKAIQWLEAIQNRDGGWGESCRSSKEKRYIALPFSTPSQTAWALDALISFYDKETPSIQKGIHYLIEHSLQHREYPTGTGLPGSFYIHYHSYHRLFPLLTFAHYIKKYKK